MKKYLSLLLALLTVLLCLPSCSSPQKFTENFFFMDTVISVTLYAKTSKSASDGFTLCKKELGELDALWSRHKPGSDVSRINASPIGEQTACDKRTLDLLRTAQDVSELSSGAFDITMGAVSDLWQKCGDENRLPDDSRLSSLRSAIGTDKIRISSDGVTRYSSAQLDLGAIGKGAAVSMLKEKLEAMEKLSGGLISFGSNVAVFGSKPDGSPFRISIRNPKSHEETVGRLSLSESLVLSVSGDYERFVTVNGRKYHHILDPKTGYPSDSGLSSVAVLTSDGALADALSTACLVMGLSASMDLYRSGQLSFEAVFVASDGTVTLTDGLTDFEFS